MSESMSAPHTAPTPPPPRPAAPKTLGRLALPPRGSRSAAVYEWFGVLFYLAAGAALFGVLLAREQGALAATLELVGLGDEPNYALTGLIVLGFMLVLRAWWSVRQDRAEMAAEEEDVEWVNLHGREGLGLVFAPAARRGALFRNGDREYNAEAGGRVETLMDDRVRRILEKARDPYLRVSPDELRGIAETRTARYGVFARYASSLLLLLAVLGTFAGVKTALPGLIDAVSQTGGAQPGGADIAAPLRAVADAFGGNALALVGAIAVGLMAQGLATGRRNLLERLELVSTEFLYGGLHGGGSVDPLTEAVRELRETAASVRDTGRAIEGLESGMNGLSESFHEAFERLNERLVELTAQQDEALHEKTGSELRELQRRVGTLAEMVEGVARAYHGIVDTVQERSQASEQAIDLMRQSAVSLHDALRSLGGYQAGAERTAAGVQQTLDALREGSEAVVARMEAVADAVGRAEPAIDTVDLMLRRVAERVSSVDERAAATWAQAAESVNGRLSAALEALQAAGARAAAPALAAAYDGVPRDPEAGALLRRIAAALEVERGPTRGQLAAAQAAGTLAALGLGYGLYLTGRALLPLLGFGS
ncbi:hypothetical protein [Longimicrobium sp.]|uniref:hypothetical protein n=1 Tax=Longimicrobium sp. TaxID=2029185 RepID=UPI002C148206|nr:hypothetical protein [Longimicrobium sp.]HSU17490.1 hypothetical protein [Longimicrobium sp.]